MKKLLTISVLIIVIFLQACMDMDNGNYVNDNYIDDGDLAYGEQYTDYGENPFVNASEQAVSTFAIDADGASYSNMRRYANFGERLPVAAVRVEEFINYFTFDYPNPTTENVSINSERTVCPWNTEHELLRIGLKGKSLSVAETTYSNFVFLIDVSGSMNVPEKLGILKTGFKLFVDELNSNDRVSIVTYAGSDNVLLPSTHGDEKEIIKNAIDQLGAGGSTAGAQGIITAYEIAQENFIQNGNNRIILGSDGDFNVGISSTEELVELIEQKRETGVYLTVLGVGSGNLNDAMMEQLANNGNGNYEYIDNIEQLKKVFIYEYSKFYTVAKDCKIQVTFNPDEVLRYRLIGYENRIMENDEFENDTTDGGEIGSNQTITALYEIIPTDKKELMSPASLEFRYKMPDENVSRLLTHNIESNVLNFENSSENMRFAVSVTGLGLLLKESQYKGDLTFSDIISWAENSQSFDPNGFRNEFIEICNILN